MNNLIMLSTKADRKKPQAESGQAPKPAEIDVASQERGAPMQSRVGMSTISQYTCFFRGATGECGGSGKQNFDNIESTVKKLQQVGEKNESDVVNDPVQNSDVRSYIAFNKIKVQEQIARDQQNVRKSKEGQNSIFALMTVS